MRPTGSAQTGKAVQHDGPIDQSDARGPFDLIGDVHGCIDELDALLTKLGYAHRRAEGAWAHPEGRQAIFVGDLADRGPSNLACIRRVMAMCAAGSGAMVIGNHDAKLARWLAGRNVTISHGLERTVAELEQVDVATRAEIAAFFACLPHHLVLDGGRL
ncbi:MAG: metallophosphoesterase, partial [Pseudomonadota bacterium]